jgi:hypothetical protein
MKKHLLTLAFFILAGVLAQVSAQIVYSEDFDGISGPTAGGAGTYNFPPGMLKRNVDNLTPDPNVSYVNEAWERREDFSFNVADSAAFSTSWYTAAGTSNDWMWTPAIATLPANCILTWNGVAYDPSYPDGYEVRIMTVAPTGGTGTIGNQLTSSTLLYSTAAEATAWTAHQVSLSAYAGQTVYIGFRNNSFDKFLLLIDDIQVSVQVTNDGGLTSIDTAQYTIEPTTQRTADNITAVVHNYGTLPLANVQLKLNVYDGIGGLVTTVTGPSLASLASNANATISAGSYTPPSTPDFYTYEYVLLHSGIDQVATNDTLYRGILIDQNIYARDDGNVVSALGIGAGNGGYLGESFQVVNNGKIDSVMAYVTQGYTGRKYAACIWNTTSAGVPTTIAAYTDTLLYPDDSGRVYMMAMDNGPYTIAPGNYVVTMIEFDSTLALGITSSIFHAGTTWINWPTNPFGGWANNEAFGNAFRKPYVIRPHFQNICFGVSASASSSPASCGSCADGSATAISVNGAGSLSYNWVPSGGSGATANGLMTGSYTVTITDANGCPATATVSVGNNCSSFAVSTSSVQASCGSCADGSATATVTNGTGLTTYSWAPSGGTAATATGLLPGTYTVTVMDASGCSTTQTVNVTFNTGLNPIGTNGSVGLYPNPSTGSFNVELNFTAPMGVDIEVLNELGERVIFEHHDAYTGGVLPFRINTPGAYTVKIQTTDGIQMIPVMINN